MQENNVADNLEEIDLDSLMLMMKMSENDFIINVKLGEDGEKDD